MLNTFQALWADERGFIISIELILITTILVLGLIVGMSCLASAVVAEFQDVGWAVRSLNQSYYFGGFRGCKAWVPGSSFINRGFANNAPIMDSWDIGVGSYGYGTGYAAPEYVAPSTGVAPRTTVVEPDCLPLAAPTTVVPCPSGDCVDGKVVPGTPLTPIPEQTLPGSSPVPQSSPVPVQPRQSIPSAPVLPPLN